MLSFLAALAVSSMLPVLDPASADVRGSSVLIAPDEVVTAWHVVRGDDFAVVMCGDDPMIGEIVAVEERIDLAFIRLHEKCGLPVSAIAQHSPEPGTEVRAVGCPDRNCGWVAVGHMVGFHKVEGPNGQPRIMIVTDAPVWFGNSGGPLYNPKGEVVGICSQVFLLKAYDGKYTRMFGAFVTTEHLNAFVNSVRALKLKPGVASRVWGIK